MNRNTGAVMVRAFAVLLSLPLIAAAHGMDVDVKVSGRTVTVSLFYDDDTPAANATVKVSNAAKEVILQGTTDANGGWAFPAPPPGEYTVRAVTDDGHAARRSFTVSAVPPPADASPPDSAARPSRLPYLAAGLGGIAVVFGLLFVLTRRKRTPAP